MSKPKHPCSICGKATDGRHKFGVDLFSWDTPDYYHPECLAPRPEGESRYPSRLIRCLVCHETVVLADDKFCKGCKVAQRWA